MGQILIMEDDDAVRLALRKMLSTAGHAVREATNAGEGARLYRELEPDLIITDLIMPDHDGVEALLELRQSHSNVKIIVISGNAQEFLPIAQDLGAHRTFAKPFNPQDVLAAVNELLAEAS